MKTLIYKKIDAFTSDNSLGNLNEDTQMAILNIFASHVRSKVKLEIARLI